MGPAHRLQPARILLVEDDPLLQDIFGATLAAQGWEVETASDGLDALWRVRDGRYDLVLCDYRLPEINGFAMARLIRDLVDAPARPALVALTGAPAALVDKEAAHGAAFDEIVAKPVDLQRLLRVVGRHLDARANLDASLVAAPRPDASPGAVDRDAHPGPAGARVGQPPPCVLIVEDDAVQRSVLQSALQTRGFTVEVAVDGFHAVRMLRDSAFDLALVDYELPELDGLATGRLILALLREDRRPRLLAFTSAPGRLAGRLAGYDKGRGDKGGAFDEVVAKSAGLPALLTAMERHLRASPRAATRRAADIVFPAAA